MSPASLAPRRSSNPAPSRAVREGETGGLRLALLAQAAALRAQADSLEALALSPAPEPTPEVQALDKREAADRLGVSVRTVEDLIYRGELTAGLVGRQVRVRPADIDAYLLSHPFQRRRRGRP